MNDPLVAITQFLKQVDELYEAKQLLNTFVKYSNTLEQYDKLGMLFQEVKAYPESLQMLEKCLELAKGPQLHAVHANLAKVYNHVNNPEKSLYYSNLNLKLNPNDYEALMEQSFSYYLAGDSRKSYEIQSKILERPNIPEQLRNRIIFNMGSFEMIDGKFKEGLRKFILGGRKIDIHPEKRKPFRRWQGEHTDKIILVYAEAGIGDEIINVRFMKEIKNRGMNAIWVGHQKDITSVFKRNGVNVVYDDLLFTETNKYVYTESMSLPVHLEIEQSELWNGPYLTPDSKYLEKWKAILPEKFLTVRWSGNPYYDQDLHRTVDRELLVNALSKYDIPIVSLQIDKKGEDSRLVDVDIESWEDTLAIQYLATHNITSCTSTVHSASAMGAPCVVLPPIATYYPWLPLKENNTSYWYSDNTVIFPQKKHKNWEETISQAINYLDTKL